MAFVIPAEADALVTLARWTEPWHDTFSSSAVISTGVLYAHVASLVCAGGLSLVADRAVLLSGRWPDVELEHELQAQAANRRLAKRALAVVALSGLLLFLSDVQTFVGLPAFWLKMGLVALLICNSLLAERSGQRRLVAGPVAGQRTSPPRLHAGVSLALWFLTLLAGTSLMAG